MRLSVLDNAGWDLEDSVQLSRELKTLGVDVIDCSSGGINDRAPVFGAVEGPLQIGYQVPLAEAIRREVDILTMAVGLIIHADQAEEVLANGSADLVAVGREMMLNPNWTLDAALKLGVADPFSLVPVELGHYLKVRHGRDIGTHYSTWQNGLREGIEQ